MFLPVKYHLCRPTRGHTMLPTSFVAATGYKRPATGFGVYSDPAIGTHVYNPGTSSERVLYGGINLRSASPTNIDMVLNLVA
ncbi:hypothetical protein P3S67_010518 [Capsicum chacoense]